MEEKYWDECSFSEKLEFSLIEKAKKKADADLSKGLIDGDVYQTTMIDLLCKLDDLEAKYNDFDPRNQYHVPNAV